MMIGMGLFWLAIILGALWLVGGGLGHGRQPQETPLALLDRRFAEGAISIDDYHRRREVLTGTTPLAGVVADMGEGGER